MYFKASEKGEVLLLIQLYPRSEKECILQRHFFVIRSSNIIIVANVSFNKQEFFNYKFATESVLEFWAGTANQPLLLKRRISVKTLLGKLHTFTPFFLLGGLGKVGKLLDFCKKRSVMYKIYSIKGKYCWVSEAR